MLQAAEHGAPQSRRRVFFWGALLGLRLPLYPQPTHVCKGLSAPTNTFTLGKTAPHNPVTIGDAISDLPGFDWRIKVPGDDRQAQRQRDLGIPTAALPADKRAPVGDHNSLYAYEPITEFQREARRYVKGDVVKNHVTRQWNHDTMLRVARIPMKPQSNHNDLSSEHDMVCLRNKSAAKSNFYPNRYYRLDFQEQFQTCLTNVDPGGENGKVSAIQKLDSYFQRAKSSLQILHPIQRRTLTVREFARAQGFLDTFTWDPNTQTPEAMYKQIGNAVSLQHGRALGKELFNALYAQWESDRAANVETMLPAVEDDSDEFEGFTEDVEMEDFVTDVGQAYEELVVISDSE
jgi:DNA (cytosine-5)-methyltransferase 1